MAGQVEEARRRTRRPYYQDGLVEEAVGLFLLAAVESDPWLMGTASLSPLRLVVWVLLPVLTIGGVHGVQRLIVALKERWIYPRTGSIEYGAEPNPHRWLVIGAASALASALAEGQSVLPVIEMNHLIKGDSAAAVGGRGQDLGILRVAEGEGGVEMIFLREL